MAAGVRATSPAPAASAAAASRRDDSFEAHFIGELDVGEAFPSLSSRDGLFVDYAAHAGPGWLPISKREGFVGQTQTAYADAAGEFVFSHPLELHYFATSLEEWPRLHLQVLRLDGGGRVRTVSYGSVALPNSPGRSELVCRTWAPAGQGLLDGILAAAGSVGVGAPVPQLAARTEVLAGRLPEERAQMVTRTSGTVRVQLDTIFRNASAHRLLVQQPRTGRG